MKKEHPYDFICKKEQIIRNSELDYNVKVQPANEARLFTTLEAQERYCNTKCPHTKKCTEGTKENLAQTFKSTAKIVEIEQ